MFFFSVQVKINIPSLPAIGLSDRLHCTVKSFQSEGTMSDSGQVSCNLPSPSLIPQTPEDQGKAFIINLLSFNASSFEVNAFHLNQSGITNGQSSNAEGPKKPQVHCMPVGFGNFIDCGFVREFTPLKYNIHIWSGSISYALFLCKQKWSIIIPAEKSVFYNRGVPPCLK